MKKSILSLVIAAALLLALTSCGAAGDSPATASPVPSALPSASTVNPGPADLDKLTDTTERPNDAPDQAYNLPATADDQLISEAMDPLSLLDLCRSLKREYVHIESADGTTSAGMTSAGYLVYYYHVDLFDTTSPAPWWETQEIPEWLSLDIGEKPNSRSKSAVTNFYPDLPCAMIGETAPDGTLLSAYRLNGLLYALYPDGVRAYRAGVEQQFWPVTLSDGCFAINFNGCTRVYDGASCVYKLQSDGDVSLALSDVTDARLSIWSSVDALVLQDGVLTFYCINAYTTPNNPSARIAYAVTDAKFACGSILFTTTSGDTYALYAKEYYDALDATEEDSLVLVRLGTDSIESYHAAYADYTRRDDSDRDLQQAKLDFFDLCAAR